MKRTVSFVLIIAFILIIGLNTLVCASDISLYNNNTAGMNSDFAITSDGLAIVWVNYEGYTGIATGATITIKIEKRTLLLFWTDVINETITVTGHRYDNEFEYQLSDKGMYRCTVEYCVSGTAGSDDYWTYQDTYKYE